MWKSQTVEVGLSDKQGINGIFLEFVWDDAGPEDVNFWFGIDAGAGVMSAAGPGASELTPLTLVSGHYDITGDRNVDAILIGSQWDTHAQTFSFPTDGAFYVGYTTGENVNGFQVFNAAQQTAARYALGLVSQYADMVFTEITETATVHADHRFANSTDNDVPSAYGNFPSDFFAAGDAWFHSFGAGAQPFYATPQIGNWGQATIMHEVGHTMGLKHGHQDYTAFNLQTDLHLAAMRFGTRALEAGVDGQPYSLMTYRGGIGSPVTFQGDGSNQPQTYMLYDIAALQFLYGANYNANAGDSVYTFSTATGQMFINGVGQGVPTADIVFRTVWDGNGIDTDDLSNYTTPLALDLDPGAWLVFDTDATGGFFQRANNQPLSAGPVWAPGNVANALLVGDDARALIENAIGGSGNDVINGNRVANVLTGGPGNDTMDGRGGNDTIDGTDGDDTAVFSGARSQYLTSGSGGSATIADQRAGSPDGTDTTTNVEHFRFSNGTYTLAEVLNQPPVLSPDSGSPHSLTEIAAATGLLTPDAVSGSLSFTDESGDSHTAGASFSSETWSGGTTPAATHTELLSAMTASVTAESPSGAVGWSFSLLDKFADFLAVSEKLTVVYDVAVADQLLNSSSVQVTIEFTGTNDRPAVEGGSSTLAGSVSELPNTTGSSAVDSTTGVVAFSDVDLSDRPTATIGTQLVTWQDATHNYTAELTAAQIAALSQAFTIAAQGGNTNTGNIDWHYDIVDKLIDFLGAGESATVTSAVVIDDQSATANATVSPDVVVTVYGANDAPIAAPDSNGTAKNSVLSVPAVQGVLSNDTDPDIHDQGHLFVAAVNGSAANVGHSVAGTYGSVTINSDGSYVYASIQGALPAKIVAQDQFAYTVSDPHGGTDTDTLWMVVFNPGVSYQKAAYNQTLIGGNGPDVLDGFAGLDTLFGGNGPDVLIGGKGDTLTGGNHPDIFLFRPGFGANVITDFDVQIDAIQFDKSIFANANDVLAHTTDSALGAVITDANADTATLLNVTLAQLQSHSGDFLFA